jgi:hypothetical protein
LHETWDYRLTNARPLPSVPIRAIRVSWESRQTRAGHSPDPHRG